MIHFKPILYNQNLKFDYTQTKSGPPWVPFCSEEQI